MNKNDDTGRVGIFWIFKGALIQDTVPCSQGEEYGDFINGKSDHCTYWPGAQRRIPGTAQYEYDQVPRGRVVYRKKDGIFLVYGSEKFIQNEMQKGMVQAAFNLPKDKIIFKADEHYSPIPGMLDDAD